MILKITGKGVEERADVTCFKVIPHLSGKGRKAKKR
jgi:hypothetical protein